MVAINDLLKMKAFFNAGHTQSYAFRISQLKRLQQCILQQEQAIQAALYQDLKKSPEECWVTETGFVLMEISNALKQLNNWMKPQRVSTNLLNFPSRSYLLKEPLGTVLIISPWNYPFQLLLVPLVGALAAGNCAVVKASEYAPATAQILQQIIEACFAPEEVLFCAGDGATVIPELMNGFVFDHVFYTGSTAVGKLIYAMAAKNLVPVTLELGGKSPCIVEADANIAVAARRIAMAKFSNAGQMCVAPDYILVHASQKEALVMELKKAIQQFIGTDAQQSYDYGRIINQKQFDRLVSYLSQGNIVAGGKTNRGQLYIEPTLLDNIALDTPIMQEEIFGPLLPILPFTSAEEVKAIVAKNPNPLALYVFTSSAEKEKLWLEGIPFGGGCVNNVALHLTNHQLPFGGRGFSGTGSYHGKFSFDTFSHQKAILKTPTWFDPRAKYPSYKGKLKLFKWMIK